MSTKTCSNKNCPIQHPQPLASFYRRRNGTYRPICKKCYSIKRDNSKVINNTRESYIYKITNILDNKCYIGQTVKSIENRWQGHQKRMISGSNRPLYNAMRKYGLDNFKIEIIEILPVGTSLEQLNTREIYWGEFYHARYPEGYSFEFGQGCGPTHPDTIKKISLAKLGKPKSEQHRQHLSEAKLGMVMKEVTKSKIRHSMLGQNTAPKTDEHKAKISAALLGRKASQEAVDKMKAAITGLKRSPEAKAKYRACKLGKKRPGLFARMMSEVIPASETVQPIYILAGDSGCGKSWVSDQLGDKYCVLKRDGSEKKYLWQRLNTETRNSKPVLFGLPMSASTAKKNLESLGYTVSIVQIIETKETIAQRRIMRAKNLKRYSLDVKLSKPIKEAIFTGTSNECLSYLK